MSEWKNCPTMKDVAVAQERGDEIQVWDGRHVKGAPRWDEWGGVFWFSGSQFRCRPRQKTKTVKLCEYLVLLYRESWHIIWCEDGKVPSLYPNCKYKATGNMRIEEVPE